MVDLILLLYADDLVILAHSETDLRNKLKVLEEFCHSIGKQVNKKKTNIVIFRFGDKLPIYKDFCYDGEKIEVVNLYTYLRIPFSSSALGSLVCENSINKSKMASGTVLSTLAKLKVEDWGSINKLFNAMINPVSLYLAHGVSVTLMNWKKRKVTSINAPSPTKYCKFLSPP